jgi:hypothetical protein
MTEISHRDAKRPATKNTTISHEGHEEFFWSLCFVTFVAIVFVPFVAHAPSSGSRL